MNKPRSSVLVGMILAAAAARLAPHAPNFTPIAAIALFGGAHFADKRLAFGVPLAALLLSDLVLGFYGGMAVVYGSFALIVGLGFWLRSRRTIWPIAGAALASSLLFFLVTNFGMWAAGSLYPRTLSGLGVCYAAAIPFFRNTLAGDLFFSAVMFGGFALAEKRFPSLREPVARWHTSPATR
jgi:hypothetical protein